MAGQWPNWGPCLILTSVLLSMVMHCSSRSGVTKIALQSRLATLQTAESLLSSVSLLAWQDSKPPLEIHQHSARVSRAIFIIAASCFLMGRMHKLQSSAQAVYQRLPLPPDCSSPLPPSADRQCLCAAYGRLPVGELEKHGRF